MCTNVHRDEHGWRGASGAEVDKVDTISVRGKRGRRRGSSQTSHHSRARGGDELPLAIVRPAVAAGALAGGGGELDQFWGVFGGGDAGIILSPRQYWIAGIIVGEGRGEGWLAHDILPDGGKWGGSS